MTVIYDGDTITLDTNECPNHSDSASTGDVQLTISWPHTQKQPPPEPVYQEMRNFRGG